MRKGNSFNFYYERDRGIQVSGDFKLDHLQSFKPILYQKISICITFILVGQF